jgi:hypothetical protein
VTTGADDLVRGESACCNALALPVPDGRWYCTRCTKTIDPGQVRPGPPETAADRLARGESVPGGPGACAACGHLTLWHGNGRTRYRAKPCQKCDCRAFTAPGEEAPAPGQPSARKAARRDAAPVQGGQLALFALDEVSIK